MEQNGIFIFVIGKRRSGKSEFINFISKEIHFNKHKLKIVYYEHCRDFTVDEYLNEKTKKIIDDSYEMIEKSIVNNNNNEEIKHIIIFETLYLDKEFYRHFVNNSPNYKTITINVNTEREFEEPSIISYNAIDPSMLENIVFSDVPPQIEPEEENIDILDNYDYVINNNLDIENLKSQTKTMFNNIFF